jgi:hypothetical protein
MSYSIAAGYLADYRTTGVTSFGTVLDSVVTVSIIQSGSTGAGGVTTVTGPPEPSNSGISTTTLTFTTSIMAAEASSACESRCQDKKTIVGVGVGVPLVVLLLVALATIAFLLHTRRRRLGTVAQDVDPPVAIEVKGLSIPPQAYSPTFSPAELRT